MINPGDTPTVKINGKAQTVLSVSDESGIGSGSLGLPIHPGLKKAGLVSSVTGYIKRVTVRCDNVTAGDTGITVDGATLTDGVSTTLTFTVGSTGRHLFVDAATGSDSNDGLSTSTPWATMAPFLGTTSGKRAIRGDVIYIKDGTYNTAASAGYSPGSHEAIIDTGNFPTSGLPIGFVNYRGHRPLFTAIDRFLTTASGGGVDGLSLFGFEVSNCGSGSEDVIVTETEGLRIGAMIMHDCACPYHILGSDYESDAKFYGNEIFACNIGSSSNQNHSIYYGVFVDQDEAEATFNHIHENEGGRGIQVFGHVVGPDFTGLINYNNIWGLRCDGIRIGGTDAPSDPNFVISIDIMGNTCHDNNQAGDVDFSDIRIGGTGSDGDAGEGPTGTIRKNVLYGSTRSIYIHSAVDITYSDNCHEGSIVDSDSGHTTDGGGNSGSYPACY